jgi:hypothetical protein
MSKSARSDEAVTDHVDDMEDGVGCTEIWERMSDVREGDDTEEAN